MNLVILSWILLYVLSQALLFTLLIEYRGKLRWVLVPFLMPLPTWIVLFLLVQVNTPCEANPKMAMNGYCETKQGGSQ